MARLGWAGQGKARFIKPETPIRLFHSYDAGQGRAGRGWAGHGVARRGKARFILQWHGRNIMPPVPLPQRYKQMKVYEVLGETGVHECHHVWRVAAFLDRDKADARVADLTIWCRENDVAWAEWMSATWTSTLDKTIQFIERVFEMKCPLDPKFTADVTGVRYRVEVIEVEE